MYQLNPTEQSALADLNAAQGRTPDGVLHYSGVLYVRYVLEFWRIAGGKSEKFTGIFPNPAITPGAIIIR